MAQPSFGRVHTLTLPTGVKVRARRPSITSLVRSGGFPVDLASYAFRLFSEPGGTAAIRGEDPAGLQRFADMIEQYLPYVLVSPKVATGENPASQVETGPDGWEVGTVALGDIQDDDKMKLVMFGVGAAYSDEEARVEQAKADGKLAELEGRIRLLEAKVGLRAPEPDSGPAGPSEAPGVAAGAESGPEAAQLTLAEAGKPAAAAADDPAAREVTVGELASFR